MKSKQALTFCAVAFALALAFAFPGSTRGETGTDPALGALVQDLQAQQKTMADNQAKIDAKLAAITETLRQARIFVSRGGK
jgi:hypothetical protein